MHLVVIGFNHKQTPLELRELLAIDKDRSDHLSQLLLTHEVIEECLILSTCNRTEIYCIGSCVEGVENTVYYLLSQIISRDIDELKKVSYSYSSLNALRHIFRVAASLDAMVVGEAQILGQLKSAYQVSVERDSVGPYLHKILHAAFRVAKKVRTDTDIAARPVSVGTLAVDLIEGLTGNLARLNVLVLGAGEMSNLVASHLKERGVGYIWIANRSPAVAEELAEKTGGVVVPFDSWRAHIATADVVVTSVGGGILIRDADIGNSLNHIIVDLAVPRNVDESVKRFSGVKLFNIDDLQSFADKNMLARQDAAQRGEKIVAAEAVIVNQELQYAKLAPIIVEIQKKCNAAVEEGLKKLYADHNHWTDSEKESARS
jgi:glutamyl-tRNA reductase